MTELEVIFLGTAGSIPTSERGLPALAIRRKREVFLFDCGEGVQRQMIKAGISFHRNTKIFITHMHGDHMLGLPGLFQTMSLLNRKKELEVYGPAGIADYVEATKTTVRFTLSFPLKINEIEKEGIICPEREYDVKAAWADHLKPSLAYSFIEKPRSGMFHPDKAKALGVPMGPLWSMLQHGSSIKLPNDRIVHPGEVLEPPRLGRKVVYTGDTRPTENVVKLAENADLLIHEATFCEELRERAHKDGHSTPSQAAEIAKKARARRLILTHISARYKETSSLLEEAKQFFNPVEVAEDFMRINLPLT